MAKSMMELALSHHLTRFIVAGAGGAVLFFCLMYAFSRAGLAPFVASASAYAICFVTIYLVHRNWTFPGKAAHGQALPRYFAIQVFCALASGGFAHWLVAAFGFEPLAMSMITAIAASGFSFFASSLWAFASTKD